MEAAPSATGSRTLGAVLGASRGLEQDGAGLGLDDLAAERTLQEVDRRGGPSPEQVVARQQEPRVGVESED